MKKSEKVSAEVLSQIVYHVAKFKTDPLGFVLNCWDWGHKDLKNHYPEDWQIDGLKRVGLAAHNFHKAISLAMKIAGEADIVPYRSSTAAGHGTGKSAFIAWIVIWAMATHQDTRGFLTAGTDTQLKSKTVPEVKKWFRSCLARPMFEVTTTKMVSVDPRHRDTWRMDFIPWSETNPDAFAGLHNLGKRIVVIMDEGQQIPQNVHETVEGAMTDVNTEIYWFYFGNASRTNGPFFNNFGRNRNTWDTRHIDSRTVRITNKAQLKRWEEEHGEDSDFFRVRALGKFPRQSDLSIINSEDVVRAMSREIPNLTGPGWTIGVDVGRFGDDSSVICPRNGYDARSEPWGEYHGLNNIQLGMKVVEMAQRIARRGENVAAIFVDQTGVGSGVVDWLVDIAIDRLPMGCVVVPVSFGDKPVEEMADEMDAEDRIWFRYRNAQIYWAMKKWLALGAIPESDTIDRQLTERRYKYWGKDSVIFLEPKDEMKKRGLPSPDHADALALTFALPLDLLDLADYGGDALHWGGR